MRGRKFHESLGPPQTYFWIRYWARGIRYSGHFEKKKTLAASKGLQFTPVTYFSKFIMVHLKYVRMFMNYNIFPGFELELNLTDFIHGPVIFSEIRLNQR